MFEQNTRSSFVTLGQISREHLELPKHLVDPYKSGPVTQILMNLNDHACTHYLYFTDKT